MTPSVICSNSTTIHPTLLARPYQKTPVFEPPTPVVLDDNTMPTNESNNQDSDGHECPTCGDVFDRDTAMKSHHRHVHGEKIGGVVVQCDECGVEMTRPPSEVETGDMNVCSKQCQDAVLGHGTESKHTCDYCGDNFTRLDSRVRGEHKFCGNECYRAWSSENIRGEQHQNHGIGDAITVPCDYCGQHVRVTADKKEQNRHFCGDECYARWQSENVHGQTNHNWRGGSSIYSAVKRQLGERSWRCISRRAKKRDGHACQMCGDANSKLHTHHIVPIMAGGTNGFWNLMTLCTECHGTVEAHTRTLCGMESVLVE